jgi:hypothetical protein
MFRSCMKLFTVDSKLLNPASAFPVACHERVAVVPAA